MLPNDVHALGNHEFDDGVAGLAPYLKALRAPVVVANMDITNEPSLKGLFEPHTVLENKGRKIGIIGLITTETAYSSNSQGVKFTDPISAAYREAELLTKKGVDIIIVLSHCGLTVDKKIAEEVGEKIDIIVGGHSHSLLWNGDSPSQEKIDGPYPVFIDSKRKPGHKILIVTASAFSKYLGNMTTYFDKNGDLQSFHGDPVFLNRSIPEDPHIKMLLKPYAEKLHSIVDTVVGFTTLNMDAVECGYSECVLGDLIADSFVDYAITRNKTDMPTIAFLLRNMMRGSVAEGNITLGDVINTLPFGNTVVTVIIKGKYILEALDKCLMVYWTQKPYISPYMPMISGLKVTLNSTSLKTESVFVKNKDKNEPIEPEKEYRMVIMGFFLRKKSAFKMFNNGRDVNVLGKDADIFREYVVKMSPINQVLDNRLIIWT